MNDVVSIYNEVLHVHKLYAKPAHRGLKEQLGCVEDLLYLPILLLFACHLVWQENNERKQGSGWFLAARQALETAVR